MSEQALEEIEESLKERCPLCDDTFILKHTTEALTAPCMLCKKKDTPSHAAFTELVKSRLATTSGTQNLWLIADAYVKDVNTSKISA